MCSERPRTTDDGFSLAETLIAVVLAGIVVAAVVGGYATALRGSNRHRIVTEADTLARAVAESVEGQSYAACPGGYTKTASDVPYPARWSPADVDVQVAWWHAASDSFTGACPDEGLQRVRIVVTPPEGGRARTLDLYKRSAA